MTALSRATDELLGRLRPMEDVPVDELARRRSNTTPRSVDGVPYSAVADSSTDEDTLREQEEGDAD